MANYRRTLAILGLSTASALALALGCSENGDTTEGAESNLASGSDLVISQVYGGGGNSGATFKQDYIELFNRGKSPASLKGLALQYTGDAFSFDKTKASLELPDVAIPPGGYFLVALAGGGADAAAAPQGTELPTPDFKGELNLGSKKGKVALVKADALLDACGSVDAGPCTGAGLVDFVGYGSASQSETAPVAELANTMAAVRQDKGCRETNNNAADFKLETPAPRTSAAPTFDCASLPDAAVEPGPVGNVAVLLNELKIRPRGQGDEAPWEYAEILCTPGAALTGYYFAAIEGDGDTFAPQTVGNVDVAIDLGAAKCGSNGILYVKAKAGGAPPLNPKSAVLESPILDGPKGLLENSTTTFAIIKSPNAPITKGMDIDPDNNGGTAGLPDGAKMVDGIATFDQGRPDAGAPAFTDVTYAPRVTLAKGVPSGLSRFKGNTEALSAKAWYGGWLAGSDPKDVAYDTESKNVLDGTKPGDQMTPGDENGKIGPLPGKTDAGRRDGSASEDEDTEDGSEEPTTGKKTNAKVTPPQKLGAVSDCSASPGPVSGSSAAAFGGLAFAIAAVGRRRRK